jgi:enoyl-CoA hydratase/carnithine racemase
MNALSQELRRALVDAFETLENDDEARVLVVTGASRAFCAGLDLKEMSAGGEGSRDISSRQNVIKAMEEFPGPIIGAINEGYAMDLAHALPLERNHSFVDLMDGNPGRLAERTAQVTARGRLQSE